MIEIINDVKANIITERKMTEEEIAQRQIEHKKELEIFGAKEQARIKRQKNRESALAKLIDLGLTEEEIAAL